MPEHEKRKARIARLLATVSVLGLSVGMFRPAAAEDLTPSQQDKWMPTAQSGGASAPQDVASPKLDAASKDANQLKYDTTGATITNSGGATEQLKLDSFSSGGPSDQLGSGGGAGKGIAPDAIYMKNAWPSVEGTKQGKFDLPAVQNKLDQPDVIYHKQIAPNLTGPGAGPTQTK